MSTWETPYRRMTGRRWGGGILVKKQPKTEDNRCSYQPHGGIFEIMESYVSTSLRKARILTKKPLTTDNSE